MVGYAYAAAYQGYQQALDSYEFDDQGGRSLAVNAHMVGPGLMNIHLAFGVSLFDAAMQTRPRGDNDAYQAFYEVRGLAARVGIVYLNLPGNFRYDFLLEKRFPSSETYKLKTELTTIKLTPPDNNGSFFDSMIHCFHYLIDGEKLSAFIHLEDEIILGPFYSNFNFGSRGDRTGVGAIGMGMAYGF